ncbi:cyclic nucleotide-binding domain-containing protein [Nannocystaceae bacterium ST9]
MADDVLAELLRLPIGEALGRGHLERLAGIGTLERHEQGSELFHEGELADTLRIVVDGRISLELSVPGRPPMILAALSRGDLLGWSALLGRGSSVAWTTTARAAKLSHCLAFPAAALRELCELDHELGYFVMQHAFEVVAQRLADARVHMLDLYGGG